ncbi:MAG: FHA domain-containing protein, partial [Anaerolineae bacterium]|nr:FHA domain-containing protein [Anaerolineae bacterium]
MQTTDNFRLIMRRGPTPNQVYDLTKDVLSLGRDISNDIVINDAEVSRTHLRLTRGIDGYTIADLGSTNGTFINGQRLTGSRPLNNGDQIGLGETVTLGYERVRPGAAAPTAETGYAPQQPSPYAPPPQQQPYIPPAQPQAPAYGAPASPQTPAPQQQYTPPAYTPGYGAQQPPAQQDYPAPSYGAPYMPQQGQPQPGYDYGVPEEEPRNTLRWVAIGCVVLLILCVCVSALALVAIDTLNLWDSVPFLR